MLNFFIIGSLIGVFMFLMIIVLGYGRDIFHKSKDWWKKNIRGFYIGFLVSVVLGGMLAVFDDKSSGSTCREYGGFASSC